jgi:hypothetical protein
MNNLKYPGIANASFDEVKEFANRIINIFKQNEKPPGFDAMVDMILRKVYKEMKEELE